MIQRNNSGQFVSGQSGNPKGRTPNALDVKKLARRYTKETIETLVKIMRSTKAGYPARVAAATELLNRGWGRVGAAIELAPAMDPNAVMRIEFVRAVDGRPAGDPLPLPAPGAPKLPAIVEPPRQKLPAVDRNDVVPFRTPRH
jgi:hypothetical protein